MGRGAKGWVWVYRSGWRELGDGGTVSHLGCYTKLLM